MKTFKKILFLVITVLSILLFASLDIFNGGGGDDHTPDIRDIRLRFASVESFGGLENGLHDYFSPIKEPNHIDFAGFGASHINVVRLLRDVPYGSNNFGNNTATYYTMHGGGGYQECHDKDVVQIAVDPIDRSVVYHELDIAIGQTIWAQIMSQCHGESLGATDIDGNGFWYKFTETFGTSELAAAANDDQLPIDMHFFKQDITDCTDFVNQEYGCDSWDAGN